MTSEGEPKEDAEGSSQAAVKETHSVKEESSNQPAEGDGTSDSTAPRANGTEVVDVDSLQREASEAGQFVQNGIQSRAAEEALPDQEREAAEEALTDQEREAAERQVQYDKERAAKQARIKALCRQGFQSCVVAAPGCCPTALMRAVLPLLAPSASFAVFFSALQPLADCMQQLQVGLSAASRSPCL